MRPGRASANAAMSASQPAYARSAARGVHRSGTRAASAAPRARPPMNAASTVLTAAAVCRRAAPARASRPPVDEPRGPGHEVGEGEQTWSRHRRGRRRGRRDRASLIIPVKTGTVPDFAVGSAPPCRWPVAAAPRFPWAVGIPVRKAMKRPGPTAPRGPPGGRSIAVKRRHRQEANGRVPQRNGRGAEARACVSCGGGRGGHPGPSVRARSPSARRGG